MPNEELDQDYVDTENACTQLFENNGVIFLSDAITQEKVSEIINVIIAANQENTLPNITLLLFSSGGDLSAAFALISIMSASNIPINTVAIGECYSGALMIFMAGQNRLIDKNTSILSHQFSAAFPSQTKASDLKARTKETDLMEERIINHYMQYTNKSMKFIQNNLLSSNDIFLTPKEAIEYGLADGYFEDIKSLLTQTE